MKQYRINVAGQTFDVQLLGDPRQSRVEVDVNGQHLTVEVERLPGVQASPAAEADVVSRSLAPVAASVPAPGPAAPAGNVLVAPLPGLVKKVTVQPGQRVASGDTLLVIEAMKMDNALRASRDGVVETVYAVEGHQVAHGAPLLKYQA